MNKNLIPLAAAVTVLGGLLWMNQQKTTAKRTADYALDTTGTTRAASFEITKLGDTARILKASEKWKVAPDSFPADTGKVRRLLRMVFTLQNRELVSTNPERLAEYGLDSMNAKGVTVYDGAGKGFVKVLIGKTAGTDYNSSYWKWQESPEVYRTPGASWDLEATGNDWKRRQIFQFDPAEAKSLQVGWKDSSGKETAYKLEHDGKDWKMLEPMQGGVDQEAATDIASRFADLSSDDFPAQDDALLASLDPQASEISAKIVLKEGKSFDFKVAALNDGYAYLSHPEMAQWVKVSSWRLDTFKRQPHELFREESIADTASKAADAHGHDHDHADPNHVH